MSEITKSEIRNPKSEIRVIWFIFFLVIIFIYFFGLNIPLLGPDEPRYAQIGREMLERDDWITPKLGGFDWFEKPALLYWLEIVSYKIFGVSEFAARFGSAVFGLLTIFSLWILGRFSPAADTERSEKENFNDVNDEPAGNNLSVSKTSAFSAARTDFADWLALIAASSIGLIVFSRAASFDIIITFPMTAALVGFFIFDSIQDSKPKVRFFALFAFYFFTGIALIAKGLIGIIFPLAIVAFYFVLSRKLPNKTFIFSLFWGTILSLAIAAVWYLPMYQANGWKFIDEFIIQHHFQRFTSDKYQHHQPFWFFFAVLPLMTLPWLPFFLASLWKTIRGQFSIFRKKELSLAAHRSSLITFSYAWLLVPLVFFSLSGSKLPGYILPALPAALILTADFVYKFARQSRKHAFFVQLTAFLMFALIAVTINFYVDDYARDDTVKYLVEAANERGYGDDKIACIYEYSHGLEFYAPNRLIRESDGKLKFYKEFLKLTADAKKEPHQELLVVAPREPAKELLKDENAVSEIIAENAESVMMLVRAK